MVRDDRYAAAFVRARAFATAWNLEGSRDLDVLDAALAGLAPDAGRTRVGVIGRRGAGKATLVAALGGGAAPIDARLPEWQRSNDVDWFVAHAESDANERSWRLRWLLPIDALLVLCPATEVDAAIDDDLRVIKPAVAAARDLAREFGRRAPRVFGITTRQDDLEPPDVFAPPFDHPRKRSNITLAVARLRQHLVAHALRPDSVIPVQARDARRTSDGAIEGGWNVDVVRDRIAAAPATDPGRDRDARAETRALLASAQTRVIDAACAGVSSAPWNPSVRSGSVSAVLDAPKRYARMRDELFAVLDGFARVAGVEPTAMSRAGGGLATRARDASWAVVSQFSTRLGWGAVAGFAAAARLRREVAGRGAR